ncbi:MAG: hypothetical protein A2402_02695 [Candidatus Staskawiczbacteria bacterium RIFOXYC1_FULL_37_43]|nr:MAG: hypothetical protein A2813_03530 [Candidatus Staskawiczbacteria bacterium RIFCSPHIGHO2_01_FULL_37_17]OGZ71163.1 MAG: hypothetical protein A2891_03870 [Candidatus Staskawiczbacteria bacterium RIFCSPLOWO2_01_FULL_37_19]OGZ76268.1 MAG: hypothetical protein A2205_00645 [Candidatus Staskawiczbacteria bacterium RIFOXYA1_FULL_37_15]OGZ80283.1 MAG: hypothetical protein A2353_03355 [Candidatus Staskawiczbacteria bacterium RIFOXYB1_FULL_38_37]OGZ81888.1 MAG: hypothetical protein A2402_02695 [Cand
MNKKTLFLILTAIVSVFPTIVSATQSLPEMVDGVKTVALSIGTAIVVVGWVVAGILYLISAGSPEKTGTAKKALIAAVIGTILIILANSGYESLKGILGNIFQGK